MSGVRQVTEIPDHHVVIGAYATEDEARGQAQSIIRQGHLSPDEALYLSNLRTGDWKVVRYRPADSRPR